MLPALLQARASRRALRIWCAASSTGQEPYSIAMCLKELGSALAGWRVEIIGTDLSQAVLEKSRAGIFSQFEVQRGLPIQMLVKHFTQIGELWQLNPDVRSMVQYRQLNLLHDFSQLGKFDVIFCRNVLIYFDQETKTRIFERLSRVIETRWLHGAGCGRIRGRDFRRLQTVSGSARAIQPECQPGRCRDATALESGCSSALNTRATESSSPVGMIACGRNRDVFPVIGFSSSWIDSPQGT